MGSSMGEEAMSISSAGEVWTADASGDALGNVAFGDALALVYTGPKHWDLSWFVDSGIRKP